MSSPCTQASIAHAAGVSVNTVSNALRGVGRVAPATRARIRALAAELGYRPDPLLAALNRRRRRSHASRSQATVAVLAHGGIGRGLQRGFWNGLQRRGEELGYVCHRIDSTHTGISEQLAACGAQGVVVLPQPPAVIAALDALPWDHWCAVAIGAGSPRLGLDHVIVDHHALMGELWQRLHAAGYRRIGSISNRQAERDLFGTPIGAAAAWGLTSATPHWCRPLLPESADDIPDALPTWLRRERPDVVVAHQTRTLRLPALRALPRCTLNRSPTDSGLAGFERRPAARGRVALDHLHEGIQRDRRGRPRHPVAIHVPVRWHDGRSLLA
ncbi:MAG: LacI family DNA-binding transcriptional regulator [Planctomycetota bacterium]